MTDTRDWWQKIDVDSEGRLEVADGWWTKPDECKAHLERFHVLAIECLNHARLALEDTDYYIFWQMELEAHEARRRRRARQAQRLTFYLLLSRAQTRRMIAHAPNVANDFPSWRCLER